MTEDGESPGSSKRQTLYTQVGQDKKASCLQTGRETLFEGMTWVLDIEKRAHSISETVCFSYSPVAQLAERLTVNQKVAGPSPAGGAIFALVV